MTQVFRIAAARAAVVAACSLAAPAGLLAQEPADSADVRPNAPVELVDRVVAVVGDTVVLYSEILESLLQVQAQGQTLPPEGSPAYDSLVSQTLDLLVDQLVQLQRAREEEITISEDVVEAETDRQFRAIRNSFPSASAFEQAITESGRTLVQYRLFLRSQVRAQLISQQFRQTHAADLPPVRVSEEEARAWFDANLEGQSRPPTVTFEQVVIRPEADSLAEAAARERAIEALNRIRDEGLDFEVAAREYSQDPANRNEGGDLGWVQRSRVDPDFALAAWSARTGRPIGPVRTQFGYHLIKVENVRGGERKIRHILIRPEVTARDEVRARELAAAVADSARAGVPMESLARRHGIRNEPVRIPNAALDRLGEAGFADYVPHLQAPIPGDVVGPFDSTSRGALNLVVLKVLSFTPRGTLDFDEVSDDIRNGLAQQRAYEQFVEQLRSEVYVDVRL